MSAARRATMVIAANRFSVFKLSRVRTSTSFLRSAIISSWVGGGADDEEDEDDEDGAGRPGSSSDDEGDSVANTERRAAGGDERATGEEREVVETFLCLAGEGGRKEQTPDVHDAHRVPRLRSHSSPLGASSHLPGWAARRAKRLAEVLTVPGRGTGEEEGASTRTRLRAGVGEDKADEEEEDTDIGEEVRRCLFLGDRRMEDFLLKLASFEGAFLLAGVEDGPATGAGGAEDEEDADREGRAADKEERRRPAELARRRTKDEGGAGGGDWTRDTNISHDTKLLHEILRQLELTASSPSGNVRRRRFDEFSRGRRGHDKGVPVVNVVFHGVQDTTKIPGYERKFLG
ncbi:hypothetical protein TREMEDRAFT_64565 [Tremella mesenterica DSM 1558]|uniref:uncharacterized protein n=1 Tax=Tremella mesenterica (strain ATCC 24925 / CBS 8224 / DSM 1558 / NBRC 9311 / NRRL Y-6157 / RJB 2259-6 / UBC 559-6) TaxID=578456 RepID=UPI0003F493B0|nr:uncharacterized protein TREMEDRAFT_64565 [Tremella mesenterica DSM 1558]EIW67316.1 hypothetical protein TREMEDRAFT_64565 [Tremella mesenterica DSM 1558]